MRPETLRGPAPVSGRAGAPEIMVTLNSEHRYISSLLEALAEQADNLLPGRKPDYALMHDIVRYMASFPDEYHHPREDLVFDRLVARDPEARPIVEELLEGHREINRRSRELLGHLERITREAPLELDTVTVGGMALGEVKEIGVGSPIDVTWGVGASGDVVIAELATADRVIACAFRDDMGSGTIPAGRLDKSGAGRFSLQRIRTASFRTHEIDFGELTFQFELGTSVTFKP